MINVSLIGSTGSIGRQVLNVVRRYRGKFNICALVSGSPSKLFEEQVAEFKPRLSAVYAENKEEAFKACAIDEADIVVNAVSGFAGFEYSHCAVRAGKKLALANKETLVCGGRQFMELAKSTGAEIIPVDSEHSAIWQCLNFNCASDFNRLIITASGGPFRNFTKEQLKAVTPESALRHPTWQMGKKITIDSATLANKGYEVIEAHVLYNAPYEKIETVIQPQSIVHSLVEFADGSVLAQMGYPTMEVPIQLALTYPERLATEVKPMDFKNPFNIVFEELDAEKYPLYKLALECGKAGGIMPCVFNACNEQAVWAFLRGEISFTGIYDAVNRAVSDVRQQNCSLEELKNIDISARQTARKIIEKLK